MLISSPLPNCSAHNDFYTSIGQLIFMSLLTQFYIFIYHNILLSPSIYVSVCLSVMCTGQMTDLLSMEKDLVTSLKDYIKAEESKLEQVKR